MLLAHFTLFTYIAPYVRAEGLPDAAIGISLSVVGASGLVGIWVAGVTADSHPRLALLITVCLVLTSFVLLPVVGSTWVGCVLLMAVWGAGLGAIGIYNQAAILRAGGEHRDAANGLTVVTVSVGLSVGALFGAVILDTFGAMGLPLAAAVPMAVALVIVAIGRNHAYPAGLRERGALA
jgi:predicted MFS family arabinose efflux permease